MEQNPYTITFGKEPSQFIPRVQQEAEIVEAFRAETPSQQVFMITGPRGSGKTVFMTDVSKKITAQDGWIRIELNPERDLLKSLASKLSSENSLASMFRLAKINLSFFGFGVEVEGVAPITDIETALSRMIESMGKQGLRLLITIDEATSSPSMRTFASAFQIFVRQGLPVFLLMTGLHENISKLQNEKSLTFLYRAPKVELKPLNVGTISRSYRRTLGVDADTALMMARLTRGYSFAFQVLGYLVWKYQDMSEEVMDEYRQYLDDYVYEKVWSELSAQDRRVAYGIAKSGNGKVSAVRETLGLESNQFSPYRKRLIKKGLISGDEHGYVRFVLPCFEDYVMENYEA